MDGRGLMTPTLPRPIEPGEIRVGDRVRLTWDEPGSVHTHEFTVTFTDDIDGLRSIGYKPDTGYTTEYVGTWELLSRPTPTPAVGSRWAHKQVGAKFVVTDSNSFYCYKGWGLIKTGTSFDLDAKISEFMVPIPDHGDGCSPWLWDEETGTAWVAGGCLDVNATHIQVFGRTTHSGVLVDVSEPDRELADRLIPWSERGQANG